MRPVASGSFTDLGSKKQITGPDFTFQLPADWIDMSAKINLPKGQIAYSPSKNTNGVNFRASVVIIPSEGSPT